MIDIRNYIKSLEHIKNFDYNSLLNIINHNTNNEQLAINGILDNIKYNDINNSAEFNNIDSQNLNVNALNFNSFNINSSGNSTFNNVDLNTVNTKRLRLQKTQNVSTLLPGEMVYTNNKILYGKSTGEINNILNPFGDYFKKIEDPTEIFVTAYTYDNYEVLSLTTDDIPPGKYIIRWQVDVLPISNFINATCLIYVNDINLDGCGFQRIQREVYRTLSGFSVLNNIEGINTFKMYNGSAEGKTIKSKNRKLIFYRVG